MRVKKLFKVLGITLTSAIVLLLLAVAVFVFNPFEGSLPDLRYVVPRDVDFFLRKPDLGDDFADFPEPHFWKELSEHEAWHHVKAGPSYRGLDGQGELTSLFEQIREGVELVREQSWGMVDPLDDAIGKDLIVAGRLRDAAAGGTAWCVYSRVAWPAKAAHGLLGYGTLQDQLRSGGMQVRTDGDLFVLESQQMPKPLYLARFRDCMLLGNDQALVTRSFELASGVGDDESFAASASYQDGILHRLRQWEAQTGQVPNALEFHLRPRVLFDLPEVTFDDAWPDPNHPTDMNARVMASFLNLQGWLFLTGSLIFEQGSTTLLADIEINQNEHTRFQREFFRTESQHRKEWLDPFLDMVPDSASACAAMRMPAGEFLREMFSALDQAERSLLDEALNSTGQYESTSDLISKLEVALYPRTGFIFRKNIPDPDIVVADQAPVPQVAWVFWLRKGGQNVANKLVDTITQYREALNFTNAFNLELSKGQGDKAREFMNPQIPGTGQIAMLIYRDFFVLSNSGPFIKDMMNTRLRPGRYGSIRDREDFRDYSKELPNSVNAFAYIQGSQLEKLLSAYEDDIVNSSKVMDGAWAQRNRGRAESIVLRRDYTQYRTVAAMPPAVRAKFDASTDRELDAMWQREATNYSADSRGAVQEARALTRLLGSAYFQFILEPRRMRLQARTNTSF